MTEKTSAAEVLSAPNVIAGMRQAWAESNAGGPNPIEQGGFVVRNPDTNALEVERVPTGERDSLSYPICVDGRYKGQTIVGTFHTHPNIRSDWTQEPSPQEYTVIGGLSRDDGTPSVRHQRGRGLPHR